MIARTRLDRFVLPLAAILSIAVGSRSALGDDVDFYRDVYPVLKTNCIACHNKTTTKAALNMESPESMRKGGDSGAGLVPGNAGESLVYQAAAHVGDLEMPPKGNKSGASNLKPSELTLFKTWIDQGAKSSIRQERKIVWRPLPPGVHPILSTAVTRDGRTAAAGRANRIYIHDLATRSLETRLADPATIEPHRDLVLALAFSPDGTRLASGSYREVKIWRAEVRDEARIPADPAFKSVAATLAHDGSRLYAADAKGTVRVVDATSGKVLRAIETEMKGPAFLAASPDGHRLAIASNAGAIEIRKVDDGGRLATRTVKAGLVALCWSGDGKQLVAGGADKLVRLLAVSGDAVRELPAAPGPITALDAVGDRIVAATAAKVLVWKGADPKPVEFAAAGTTALAIALDGTRLALGRADGAVEIRELATGKSVIECKGDLATAEKLAEIDLFVARSTLESTFQRQEVGRIEGLNKGLDDLLKKTNDTIEGVKKDLAEKEAALKQAADAVEAARKIVAPLADKANQAKDKPDAATETALRDARAKLDAAVQAEAAAANLAKIRRIHLNDAEAEARNYAAAIARNKKSIESAEATAKAAGTDRDKANAEAAAIRKAAASRAARPVAVRFSRDGRTVAASMNDGSSRVWAIASGLPVAGRTGANGEAVKSASVASLPDGGFAIATDAGATERIGRPRRWVLERTLGGESADSPFPDRVNAVRFSPDGKSLAVGSGEPSRTGDVSLWDVATGKPLAFWRERHADAVLSLDFSPDGKLLASGAADKTARVTEIASGKVVNLLEGHTHHVLGVSFRADGRVLATAGGDATVVIWDMILGERKRKIEGWGKEVTAVQFIGATNQFVASCGDDLVRIADDAGGQVRSFAKLPDFMQSAASATTSNLIVAGGEDSVLRVWNRLTGTDIAAFEPPDAAKPKTP